MLALDHRSSLKRILSPENPGIARKEDLISFKEEVLASLMPQLSGFLIDPEYGLEAYKKLDTDKRIPYLLCIEKTGYQKSSEGARTEIQYSVSQLKEMGASGIKLLLPFHPKKPSQKHQLAIAQKVLTDARQDGVPLFLEIILEPQEGNKETLIPESVKMFLDAGIRPDVFKLEYPGSAQACQEITEMLKLIPWILLTRGIDFEDFKKNLIIAVRNGASGFLAGRALWQEAGALKDQEKKEFLENVLPKRFEEISHIALGR